MTDTTASINSKGLDGTGVTEDMASDLFGKVGTHLMAIVDLQVVDKHGPNLKGKRKVVLTIDAIEPALDETLAEHLRELTRTLYFNRRLEESGPTLDAGEERTVDDVLAAGRQYEPHPYIASTLSVDDNAVCDVCGQIEGAAVHADRTALADPFAVVEDPETDEDQEDEEDGDDLEDEDLDYGDADDDPAA